MKKKNIYIVLALMVFTMAAVSFYYWYQNEHYVTTEDARVDGDIVKVSPEITGKIIELPVEENQYLNEGELIGRLSDINLPPGSSLDLSVIRAPISGTVIKKIGHVGEMGTPGVPVVMLADLNSLYITANIEEDKLHKVQVGQYVEYTIDSFPGVKFEGKVISIGKAANSVFSIIPRQNTGNNFTKVTQRIPVKISINDYHNCQLLPGMNAVVKIHIK
ncbi:MAG: HlyD family secretion protein [Desulfotomaculum sp.]|nr:HlyD family secretion protein [Desulfotomaculum sp.]